MKKLISLILAIVMILSMAACSNETSEPEEPVVSEESGENSAISEEESVFEGAEVSVGMLKGPTGMGAAWLMDQAEQGLTLNSYDFTLAGAADELTGRLIQGDLDIAALPTNAISALYNKTEGEILCLGINTLGVLYILENGNEIESFSDLDGKTVLASGQGSTAEYVLNHIITEHGIDVEIYWASEHTEAATLAITGEYDIVMLPEPFVTNVMSKNENLRVALDIPAEWESLTGGVLTMGGIAVRRDFAEENPEAVAAFIEEYNMSIENINGDLKTAGALIEKYEIAAAAVAESALPRCNIVWLYEDYKPVLESFLTVLHSANPAGIGGKLPAEDFYYGN